MSRNVGRKLQNTADEYNRKMDPGLITGADNDADPSSAGGVDAKSFPRQFQGGPSKEWVKMQQLKDEMTTDPATQMTKFGQRILTDNDLKQLLKAEESAKEVALDSWFQQNWNKADLPTRILAQKLYPEFYEKRENDMMTHAEMVLKIKKIQLRGPRTPEEVQIVYGIESGDIALYEGWDKIGYVPGLNKAQDTWMGEMLKKYTFWDTSTKRAGNAKTNITVGGGLGTDPNMYTNNMGNKLLFADAGKTPTQNIFSRLGF